MTDHDERLEIGRGPSLKFTPSGQKRMEEYQTRFATVLRRAIRDQNPSFTERTVEVTAADVDKALDGVKLISTKRVEMRRLALDSYIVVGIICVIVGIFFSDIQNIVKDQPLRLAFIICGSLVVFLSVLVRRFYKVISIARPSSPGLSFFVSDLDDNFELQNESLRRWRNARAHDLYNINTADNPIISEGNTITVRDSRTGEIRRVSTRRPSKTTEK